MSLSSVGSTGGLVALAKGICHLASSHLFEPETGTYNMCCLATYLPEVPVVVINLVHRDLGLIVGPGNPLKIETIADLARPGVRIVNRQAGSGTRVFFDHELKQRGMDAATLEGYGTEVVTHNEAALAVLGGSADAAVGLFSAARMLSLDFVHLTKERFDLIVAKQHIASPAINALLQVLRSESFKDKVSRLGGYDLSATGHLISAT
jgi:putative molybdopterin biosynthesis protein